MSWESMKRRQYLTPRRARAGSSTDDTHSPSVLVAVHSRAEVGPPRRRQPRLRLLSRSMKQTFPNSPKKRNRDTGTTAGATGGGRIASACCHGRKVPSMSVVAAADGAVPRTSLGSSIPDTAHAVSVSLPTWRANVSYEEGHDWVVGKMKSGYPRFFIHPSIQKLSDAILGKFGEVGKKAFLFPTANIAQQCLDFIKERPRVRSQCNERPQSPEFRVLELMLRTGEDKSNLENTGSIALAAAIVPADCFDRGKSFWQHSGEGTSSRRAEFLHQALLKGYLFPNQSSPDDGKRETSIKGPRRYQKETVRKAEADPHESPLVLGSTDYSQFIEERFGRNLDPSLANQAKRAIRKRIATSVNENAIRQHGSRTNLSEDNSKRAQVAIAEEDVYLYPSGMSAIFNSHRVLKKLGGYRKSVMFGFPYIDTLKILEKFGPEALFYGNGCSEDLDDLERRCSTGEQFLALYCEFPGNPLLKTPNLRRIRQLADQYGFAVVVDETIGNFLNVNVLPQSDIVVSSLTKVFSGDSNVMGGSLALNPAGKHYDQLKAELALEYEDNYWPEDAIYMERNSRDFVSRNERINANAEAVCTLLQSSSLVKKVYYPKSSDSRSYFDDLKNPKGGYGGLFSVTFNVEEHAHLFFDALETEKGPSLGTNFTLSCPFVILAHYNELEWASQYGVEPDLVRVSVGLEDTESLVGIFKRALDAVRLGR